MRPSWGKFGRPSTMIWPQRQPRLHTGRMRPDQGVAVPHGPYSETVRGFMSKEVRQAEPIVSEGQLCPVSPPCAAGRKARPRIALLSNPKDTGNIAKPPHLHEYGADPPDG